jgi:ABC-type nitrate/sulfonate/bicarbonate transport system ATPase subunit
MKLWLALAREAGSWNTLLLAGLALVAYAPQGAVLFEGSLADNLLLGRVSDRREREALLTPWLERLGLEQLWQRPESLHEPLNLAVDCFSGGEIHRQGLLRAWLQKQPVELLDEPTAFLDAQAATRVRKLVLVATHDPELMAQAAVLIHPAAFERHEVQTDILLSSDVLSGDRGHVFEDRSPNLWKRVVGAWIIQLVMKNPLRKGGNLVEM